MLPLYLALVDCLWITDDSTSGAGELAGDTSSATTSCDESPAAIAALAVGCDGPAIGAWFGIDGPAPADLVLDVTDGATTYQAHASVDGLRSGSTCCGSFALPSWTSCADASRLAVRLAELDAEGEELACVVVQGEGAPDCPLVASTVPTCQE